MNSSFPLRTFGEMVEWFDSQRIPVKSAERRRGPYPYYGASGVVDWVDDYIFEGLHLLVSEDGENLRSRTTPIAFLADGRYWVNNHAHVVRGNERSSTRFLCYAMSATDIAGHVSGSAQPKLSRSSLEAVLLPAPSLTEQRAIADVLGALDDKIAANDRKLGTVNDLEDAIYLSACADVRTIPVGAAAEFLNRRRIPLSSRERSERQGVVPYYGAAGQIDTVDSALFDEPIVLVGEDGTVQTGDGRAVVQYVWGLSWVNNHAHVLVGKGVSTDVLRVALRRLSVADAVTGAVQPKLSMARLSALPLLVPTDERLASLGGQLTVLGGVIRETTAESRALTALRDTLLPKLMSGRMRVKDAESTVEEVL